MSGFPAANSRKTRGMGKNTVTIWLRTAWQRRLAIWARRVRLTNKIAIALFVAAVLAGMATYAALSSEAPGDTGRVFWLLNLDLVLLLMLVALVARQAVGLWAGRRRGMTTSKLHVRLVFLFSLLAAVPAILMATFSAVFFYFGVHAWFSDRVSTAVNESLLVAQSYLEEHQQVMRADVLAMANDLNREASALIGNPAAFNQVIQTQSLLRNLPEVVVFTSSGQVLARSRLTFSLDFDPLPENILDQTRAGEVALMTSENDDRIRALVKLENYFDTYLFVGRRVDSEVLAHLDKTQDAVREYDALQGRQSELQITIMLLFVAVATLLLMAAIWFGLVFARQLANPISALVSATERVRAGDMLARVAESADWEEFKTLNRAFNRMTEQISSQRSELIDANRLLDDRRRFTEAVLSGVSSGVIGADGEDRIIVANLSAARFLGLSGTEDIVGCRIGSLAPEMADIISAARSSPEGSAQGEIAIFDQDRKKRTLLVRVSMEDDGDDVVATFDDITELLSAQRKAAWADVARRIAHEIKNPLTPIQLSAERLRRKYLKEIQSDPQTFEQCTETIVRQVADIGRMVDEFSSFARMPLPVKRKENLVGLCEEALVLQRAAHQHIKFDFSCPAGKAISAECDRQQVHQALTNLLQNAIDSINARREEENGAFKGKIDVSIGVEGGVARINVEDNGKGLPEQDRDKLSEPYVTTRIKGTGLGLAIVRKIMEDHGGSLSMEDRKDGQEGACVTLLFAVSESHEKEAA